MEWVVHVERQQLREVALAVYIEGRPANQIYYQVRHGIKIEAHPDESPGKMETWYARDEESARQLALSIATENPGRAIYVAKVMSVTQCAAMPPTVSKYTDKGLIPQ